MVVPDEAIDVGVADFGELVADSIQPHVVSNGIAMNTQEVCEFPDLDASPGNESVSKKARVDAFAWATREPSMNHGDRLHSHDVVVIPAEIRLSLY